MSLHINKFIDRVRSAESRNLREFTMSIREAQELHADITKLLLAVTELQNRTTAEPASTEVLTVEVQGGSFI